MSRRPLARAVSVALLAAAFVVLALSCSPTPESSAIAFRFIHEDPQELFDPARLYTQDTVFDWSFASAPASAAWEAQGIDEVWLEGGALALRSTDPNMQLLRAVDFDAADINTLEMVVENVVGGRVAVEWAGPAEPLSAERRLVIRSSAFTFGTREAFRFELTEHPAWRGRIQLLRLRFVAGNRKVRLHRVRGIAESLDSERLAEAARRPRKVDIHHDVRNVLLAVPGRDIRRELEVPADGRLEFAWGVAGRNDVPVRFEVVVAEPQAPPRTIFTATARPGAETWHNARLNLDAWTGRRVGLILRVMGGGPLALPVWANPEVLDSAARERPPSIVLVSVDTLRADRLSLYGYERPTSPHLDAWARRHATTFHTVVASAPWTLPAHVALFTGLDAVGHGVNHFAAAPASLVTLAEQLRGAGYTTLAITGGAFLRPELGLIQGFDAYRYSGRRLDDDSELEDGIAQALHWLDRYDDRPLFLFFHTYEVHSPHISRQPYLRQLTGRTYPDRAVRIVEEPASKTSPPGAPLVFRARSIGSPPGEAALLPDQLAAIASDLYDSGVAYTDHHLGRLLERLQQPGNTHRTVVVITSDHGEMLGEHGQMSHATLYDENLLVPLVLAAGDGRGAGLRVDAQVRQVDVLPTLLALAGDLPPAAGIDGVSLTPFLSSQGRQPPRHAWSYGSRDNAGLALRVDGRFKYVFRHTAWSPFRGREIFFRLDQDPRELHDARDGSGMLANLRRRTQELLATRARGLRIQMQNREALVVRGTLAGPAIKSERVKTWDLSCPCLELLRDGLARFNIPPGQRFTLLLEAVEGEELALTIEVGELGPPYATSVRLAELAGTESIVLADGQWRRAPGNGEEGAVKLSFWWHQDAPAPPPPPPAAKALLDQELRALGYVH